MFREGVWWRTHELSVMTNMGHSRASLVPWLLHTLLLPGVLGVSTAFATAGPGKATLHQPLRRLLVKPSARKTSTAARKMKYSTMVLAADEGGSSSESKGIPYNESERVRTYPEAT
eukprot:scaffold164848_cov31-Tisochrysis_lutea.AAC.1